MFKTNVPSSRNYIVVHCMYMVILFIASLNGRVFESVKILGNSFCYCGSEKK
jgi:hypothetical protein